MKTNLYYWIGVAMLTAMPFAAFGQDGTDINQAIPIYFGQSVNDIGDVQTVPFRVYSMVLAKGQQITATLTAPQGQIELSLWPSTKLSVAGQSYFGSSGVSGSLISNYSSGQATSWTYTVAASGTYYLVAYFGSGGTHYSLQVNAAGTPLLVPNPPQAGCLTGQVDSITYSLQLIAAGLPDTASIGGVQMCASCAVKAPAYPALVEKLEKAMSLGVGVSACYDASGNIFQLKLMHP